MLSRVCWKGGGACYTIILYEYATHFQVQIPVSTAPPSNALSQ